MATKKAKFKKVSVELPNQSLTLYAGQKVRDALRDISDSRIDVYLFTRFQIVMRAVYEQGLKDGRGEVIDELDSLKNKTNYLSPGRPKKS